jgi:hypothetical protein
MKTIKLFVAAAIVTLAASCGAKEQPAAETAPAEETAPAATPEATDTTVVAPADTTAAAQ